MSEELMSEVASGTGIDVDAVVVGAGLGGLYMLYKLRELGLSAQAFEAGDGVGGTWFWNRYPGARCDVESLVYSYSFDAELEQEWEWSERYPSQPEIESYVNHVADRFDLRRDISFETKVVSAVFDEDTSTWTVATDTGRVLRARFFITAVGCLSQPKQIDIAGVDSFAGETYVTASWPEGAGGSVGEACRGDRDGFVGDSGDPSDRGGGWAFDGVPADPELFDPGA